MNRRQWSFGAAALALLVAASCDESAPSGMRVTVQRWLNEQQCWATMTEATVDPALAVPGEECAGTVEPQLTAGADRVRAIIDYGDLSFTPGTTVPPPTLTMTLDGVETPTGASLESPPRRDGRAYFVATFTAPLKAAAEMKLKASAAEGFAYAVPETFHVDAASVGISVEQCAPDAPCELVGGVGSAVVSVVVPGTTTQEVTVTSTIDDVAQPGERVIVAKTQDVMGGEPIMIGRDFVNVPAEHDGALWQLTARFGIATGVSPVILLRSPSISASIACGAPCEVIAKSSVSLVVSAPAKSQFHEALVSAMVNNAPVASGVVVPLNVLDINTDRLSGTLSLAVPDAPGKTWQIDVTVGPYRAPTVLAVIQ